MRALLAIGLLLLPGCLSSTDPSGNGAAKEPVEVAAPWWPLGAWWDVEMTRGGATSSFRLVNFLNESDHFWLGVADRRVALDHALHDTNPLLGRIHWGILTPHEKGIHANGLFTFPIKPGKTWEGKMFGRDWNLKAEAGPKAGSLVVTGVATDGATTRYDYDPDVQWFTGLEIKTASGATDLRFRIADHGRDAKGAYWFLRGRDYYEGPKGNLEDSFNVCTGPAGSGSSCKEEREVKALAIEIDATFPGPGRVEFRDPAGNVKKEVTVAGGTHKETVEIANPPPGAWKVRYVGTGVPTGRVHGTGILEYTATR